MCADAGYLPVARLDTVSIPILASNLRSYLENARLVENPAEARALVMRAFLLPEEYEARHEPAVCHWLYDDESGYSNGLCRVVVVPASDRGEALVMRLRRVYRDFKTADGFFFFDTPFDENMPQSLVIFAKATRLWIATGQKPLLWAALNEHLLLKKPEEATGMMWVNLHPQNLLTYSESKFAMETPVSPLNPFFWIRSLGFIKPTLEAFQSIWVGVKLERNAVALDFRLHLKTFSDIGQVLASWTNPGADTEAFVPAINNLALVSGIPPATDNPPFFGTLGHGMKDFALYVAETRTLGPHLVYVAEIGDAENLASRLADEIPSLKLLPGTRVVPVQKRALNYISTSEEQDAVPANIARKRALNQVSEIYSFRLEGTAPADNLFAAPLQAFCSALAGDCWTDGRHIFATLAPVPAAEAVIQQGMRQSIGARSSTVDRVRRGLQKIPENIRFAIITSPSSVLRSIMVRMPGAEKAKFGSLPAVQDGVTLVVAEERYGILRLYVQLNSAEINLFREILERGQPVIEKAAGAIERHRE